MDQDLKKYLREVLKTIRSIPEEARPKWLHLGTESGVASYRLGEDLDSEEIALESSDLEKAENSEVQKKEVRLRPLSPRLRVNVR